MPQQDNGKSSTSSGSARSLRRATRRNWLKLAGGVGLAGLAGCSGNGNNSDGGDGGGGGGDGGSGGGNETPTETSGGGNGTTTGDASNNVTVIEYWRWPHSTEPSNTAEDQIVEEFNNGPGAEQGIRVEQNKNPFGQHNQALRTAIGSNDAPAIAWSFPRQLYDYSGKSRDTIEQNAPYVYVDNYISSDFHDQFWQPFWDWQQARFGGLVGVPFIAGLSPGLMYVNTDAWEAAGLGSLPEGSWSWEEYLNAAEQIDGVQVNGSTVNGVGIGLSDAASAAQWDAFLTQMSRTAGSLIGAGYQEQDGKYALTIASDPEVESWNAYFGTPIENGWTNNPSAYTRDGIQDPFDENQIGLLAHSTFSRVEFSQQDNLNFDIIPYPTKDGNENYSVYSGGGFSVTFTAFKEEVGGHPEEAMTYIQFRNNARHQYEWFNTSSQTVPNKEAYQLMQDEGVSDFVSSSRGLEVMDRVNQAMNDHDAQQEAIKSRYPDIKVTEAGSPVTTTPRSVGNGRVPDAMGGALQRLVQNNNSNPQEAITRAENQWADLIKNSSDLAFDESSRGYNKPTPQAGPL